jgi:dsRNA-specific ribonuclease
LTKDILRKRALARTRAELELEDTNKLVWFLASRVALCHQHHKTITMNLPAYQARLLQLIAEATTSGAANFTASYERLEHLGDAVLKYCTHVQLAAQHPDWPESYLTAEKGRTGSIELHPHLPP